MCCLGKRSKTMTTKKTVKAWRTWQKGTSWDKKSILTSPVYSEMKWRTSVSVQKSFLPDLYNECGFYAFKSKREAMEYDLSGNVVGQVELSGQIVHHRLGYRAEKVRILSLSDPDLAKKYRVKCCAPKKRKRKVSV